MGQAYEPPPVECGHHRPVARVGWVVCVCPARGHQGYFCGDLCDQPTLRYPCEHPRPPGDRMASLNN